jgi:hypothetical protein
MGRANLERLDRALALANGKLGRREAAGVNALLISENLLPSIRG